MNKTKISPIAVILTVILAVVLFRMCQSCTDEELQRQKQESQSLLEKSREAISDITSKQKDENNNYESKQEDDDIKEENGSSNNENDDHDHEKYDDDKTDFIEFDNKEYSEMFNNFNPKIHSVEKLLDIYEKYLAQKDYEKIILLAKTFTQKNINKVEDNTSIENEWRITLSATFYFWGVALEQQNGSNFFPKAISRYIDAIDIGIEPYQQNKVKEALNRIKINIEFYEAKTNEEKKEKMENNEKTKQIEKENKDIDAFNNTALEENKMTLELESIEIILEPIMNKETSELKFKLGKIELDMKNWVKDMDKKLSVYKDTKITINVTSSEMLPEGIIEELKKISEEDNNITIKGLES